MNLTGLFQYGNKNTASRNNGNISTKDSSHATSTSSTQQTLRNLAPGQTIQGEVVAKNGNEVQIMVDKEVVLTARLDQDIPIAVGQNMVFEVKNPSGTQIALRPLFENMAQDANVLKALEAAKLPTTDEWVRMVSAMMKQGMSIDKNALLDMGKVFTANAGAKPETVVMLKALNLPVTPENIQQFENYQSYEHQILQQVSDVLLELPQTYQTMISAGQGNAAVDFYTQLLNLFTGVEMDGGLHETMVGNRVFSDIIGEYIGSGVDGVTVAVQGQGDVWGVQGQENAGVLQNQMQEDMTKTLLQIAGESDNQAQMGTEAISGSQNGNITGLMEEVLRGIPDAGSREQLAAMLGKVGLSEALLVQVREGTIAPEQLMKVLQQTLAQNGETISRTDLMQLFGSKEYNQLLNRAIQQQWLIKPEEVADKKDVEAFYGRLKAQTAQLLESLGQVAKDTPLAKSLTNMQNNIDFMNQVNQAFQYIQLPLKMSGGNAHGDLYVYANRRNAPSEDGSVSALLHLDMEHLGTMDIHVKMKDRNVSTKFYLQDESVIDFITQHIHILNERLQKRGYSMQAEMVVAEDKHKTRNVMETITAQEKKATLLAQYSFDVRA